MNEDNPELLRELRDLIASRAGAPPDWKPSGAIAALVQPDDLLSSIVGSNPMTRSELGRRLWTYIHEHNLQDPDDRWMINADDALARMLNGRRKVGAIEVMRCAFKHVK